MKIFAASRTCAVAALALVAGGYVTPPALAQSETQRQYEGLTAQELRTRIKQAKFYRTLGSSKQAIDAPGRCGPARDEVRQTQERYDQLKTQNELNPTDENKREAATWQAAIDDRIADYKICFAENLRDFGVVWGEGVTGYEAHRERFGELRETYKQVPDINVHIQELQAALEKASMATATLTVAARTVEVRSEGTGWRPVSQGYQFASGDHVRTGPDGRARLEFNPAFLNPRFAGPAVVNLGANAQIRVGSFLGELGAPEKTVFDLINGAIRVFIPAGSQQDFNVRTSATVAAAERNTDEDNMFTIGAGSNTYTIRGTEIALNYDPVTDEADYTLDHGSASYTIADGAEVPMAPRTAVSVTRDRASAPRAVSNADWQGVVEATDPPYGFGEATGSAASDAPAERVDVSAVVSRPAPLRDNRASDALYSITASYANTVTTALLQGLKNADPEQIYASTDGDYRAVFDTRKAEGSGDMHAYFETSSQRPSEFRVGCTACTAGSEECWTWADIGFVVPGAVSQTVVFVTRRMTASEMRVTTSRQWSRQAEAEFNNLGEPYCE